MKVAELGIILDVGISKRESYSPEKLWEQLQEFFNAMKQINECPVVYVRSQFEPYNEIPNFNYNIYNQMDKNERYRVFRSFKTSVFIQYRNDFNLIDFDKLYWYKHKGLLCCISVSSLGKRKIVSRPAQYLGTSQMNSGEIVEERVSQLTLFQ